MSMQCGLLHSPVHTHGFTAPEMLNTGAMWLFVNRKLAAKLPATIQTTTPLTIILPTGKILVANIDHTIRYTN